MTFQTLELTHDSGIATVTLNRPEKRNALSIQLLIELSAALDEVESSDAQVLLLTGAGKAFCAGMDLEELKSLIGKSQAESVEDSRRMARIFRSPRLQRSMERQSRAAVAWPRCATSRWPCPKRSSDTQKFESGSCLRSF